MFHRVTFLVSAIALFAGSGCRQVIGLDDFTEDKPDGGTSSKECQNVGYPPRPAGDDGGNIEFVVVQSTWNVDKWPSVGGRLAFEKVGFNLDRRCTTGPKETSCMPWKGDSSYQIDGPAGRDNVGVRFLSDNGVFRVFLNIAITGENLGLLVALLRVRGYNGLPDDGAIQVDYLGATTRTGQTPGPLPLWNGQDRFRIVSDWLVGHSTADGGTAFSLDEALASDRNAYVSGGRLVATFPKAFLGGPFAAQNVVVSGDLKKSESGWRLDNGVLGWSWSIVEVTPRLLPLFSTSVPDGGSVITECGVSLDPLKALAFACPYADLASKTDDPTLPCDAISWGSLFTGIPAQIDLQRVEPPEDLCHIDLGSLSCSSL